MTVYLLHCYIYRYFFSYVSYIQMEEAQLLKVDSAKAAWQLSEHSAQHCKSLCLILIL